jgi:hypothetical protein
MADTDDRREPHAASPHDHPPSHVDNPEVEHEESDVNVRGILIFIGGLGVAVLLVFGLMALGFWYLGVREAGVHPVAPPMAVERPDLPPEPRLQSMAEEPWSRPRPEVDLERFRAMEDRLLNGYEWVDRPAGTVRIPIERAMELIVDRLPARPAEEDPGEFGRLAPRGPASGRSPRQGAVVDPTRPAVHPQGVPYDNDGVR